MKRYVILFLINVLILLYGITTVTAYSQFPTDEPEAVQNDGLAFPEHDFEETPSVERMMQALKSKDPYVRVKATQALGEVQDFQAVEALVAALKDKNLFVRAYAAEALGKMKAPSAVETLLSVLNEKDAFVQAYVVESLGEIQDPKAVDPLIQILSGEDKNLRQHAAWALGNIKDPRAVEPLIAALQDSACCDEAAAALREITEQDFGIDYERWLNWWEKNGKE